MGPGQYRVHAAQEERGILPVLDANATSFSLPFLIWKMRRPGWDELAEAAGVRGTCGAAQLSIKLACPKIRTVTAPKRKRAEIAASINLYESDGATKVEASGQGRIAPPRPPAPYRR